MDAQHFDWLAKSLTARFSRRRTSTGLLLALSLPLLPGPEAEAKKSKKKKRCRRCRAAGKFCKKGKCVECLNRANCPPDPAVCQTFVCTGAGACAEANTANGTGCGGENECRDGDCVQPPVCDGRNDSCSVDGECCSNSCNLDPQLLVCNASPNGGSCKVDFDCASENCVAFVCEPD